MSSHREEWVELFDIDEIKVELRLLSPIDKNPSGLANLYSYFSPSGLCPYYRCLETNCSFLLCWAPFWNPLSPNYITPPHGLNSQWPHHPFL
jgi:hypothetical protein